MQKSSLDRKCIFCGTTLEAEISEVFDTRFGIKSIFRIANCLSCGLVQTTPALRENELKRLYGKYYNFIGIKTGLYVRIQSKFFLNSFAHLWTLLDGDISFYYMHGKGRLLDLGCNEGRGLQIYKKNGYITDGLELNEIAAAKAKDMGFKVSTKPLEYYHPKKCYDVVVLSNVLEHSLNPKKMLTNISRILKKGGQVWISCPNVNSWQRKLFKKYWINWHVPFHIFHFSKKTLSKLLKETGFQIVEEKQKSPSLWMAQSLIARLFAKPGQTTIQMRKAFLVASLMLMIRFLLFPLLWIGNLLGRGDCLLVVAKKV